MNDNLAKNGNLAKIIESSTKYFNKYKSFVVWILLAAIVIYSGIYLRTLNISGLKDFSTGEIILAPDLDPYLYLRWAKDIVANGSIPTLDTMRYAPIGFDTSWELTLPAYMIAGIYNVLNYAFPGQYSVEYAAVIFPVIFFCLFLIAFFLFVRKTFSCYPNSEWMAVIATAIVSILPGMLHRTLAGVPEKEAPGLFFMFLALYFLACAFKSESKWSWKFITFGLLAGIATGFMGLVWGGITFLFIAVPLGVLLMFFFSDIKTKDVLAYAGWVIGFTIMLLTMTIRYGAALLSPVAGGIAYVVLVLLVCSLIFKKKLHAIGATLGLILAAILIINPQFGGKNFLAYLTQDIFNYVMKPFATDRLTMTVAENSLAYFGNWIYDFGTAMFWIFMFGSVFLVYGTFNSNPSRKLMACSFAVLMFGLIFSRYASSTSSKQILISNILFIGSIVFFIICLCVAGNKQNKQSKAENGRKYLDKNLLMFVAILAFSVFCSRSAVRLFYFVYPIVPIVAAYFLVRMISHTKNSNETAKIMAWGIIMMLCFSMVVAVNNYNTRCVEEARGSITNYYNVQWQYAMSWVRENTSPNAVFAHWWDYGYWVQTLGERATVLDGGNLISYWDHLMGGLVLTGDASNMTKGIEFLKTHKATHLLIDSSDIGKYPAYSNIGSNENYDKLSSMQPFVIDESGTQERRNDTIILLRGYSPVDEDFYWGGRYYASGSSGVAAFLIPLANNLAENEDSDNYKPITDKPLLALISGNVQSTIPINCIYYNGKKYTFEGDGIGGCLFTMPMIKQDKIIPIGAALWLSPRLMRSEMVHLYILDEKMPGFNIVHYQDTPLVTELNGKYGLNLSEIVYHQQVGLLGPIKIWEINYSAYPDAKENMQYLNKTYPSKGLWQVNQ